MNSTDFHQAQTNRVADVSNALDDLPRERQRQVWDAARDTALEGELSFLQALEDALAREPGWPQD